MAKITIDDTLDFTPDTLSEDGTAYVVWVPVSVDKSLVDSGIVNKVAKTYDFNWSPMIPDPVKYPKAVFMPTIPEADLVPNPKTAAQAVAQSWYKELAQRTKMIVKQTQIEAFEKANPIVLPPSVQPFA